MVNHIIRNTDELLEEYSDRGDGRARRIALSLLEEALKAANSRRVVRRNVKLARNKTILRVREEEFELAGSRSIYVIGGGKASGAMAEEVDKLLGGRILVDASVYIVNMSVSYPQGSLCLRAANAG